MKKFLVQNAALIISSIVLLVLFCIPTGYEDAIIYKDRERCVAKVLEVHNENVVTVGILSRGDQTCTVELLDGMFKGQIVEGFNMLTGSIDSDKMYQVGDEALVLVSYAVGDGKTDIVSDGNVAIVGDAKVIVHVSMVDHYRLHIELILVGLFALFLVITAGRTGLRAIVSFGVTILSIWKILIPLCLNGHDPIIVGFMVTAILTIIIISLVYGFDRMMLSATIGSLTGSFVTMMMALIFTDFFMLEGSILQGSQSLLYSGFPNLDLKKLFIASIFIGSSGAVMDLAVDITSSVKEVVDKKPDITAKEAICSGMNVGRAAMGTMTTTLLLAYSGGYISLLMIFMAQGTPIDNILNYKYVASEILDTIVGSFGLVSVAPLTALCAGLFLTKRNS
ncbi:MAG: YibE/F family protein [Pseudomonadota bacterium]